MINPRFNIWYLTDLLAAMTALLLRYATILIVVSAEEPPNPGIQAMQLNFVFIPSLTYISMQHKEYIYVIM